MFVDESVCELYILKKSVCSIYYIIIFYFAKSCYIKTQYVDKKPKVQGGTFVSNNNKNKNEGETQRDC